MRKSYFLMLLACTILSCTPLKQLSTPEYELPTLAVIGKKDKSLLHTTFKKLGEPVFSKRIALTAQAIPFTKSTYRVYQNMKAHKGENVRVQYVDSLPKKPRFLQFEIKDIIGLTSLLNTAENKQVQSYLTKDADCKIVSNISIYVDEMKANDYLSAKGLFLVTDSDGMLRMEMINGKQRHIINLPKNEIFDYEIMGFCWGENVYGKPWIETLNTGGKCPEGTEKNAQNLNDLQNYLKL